MNTKIDFLQEKLGNTWLNILSCEKYTDVEPKGLTLVLLNWDSQKGGLFSYLPKEISPFPLNLSFGKCKEKSGIPYWGWIHCKCLQTKDW